MADPDMLKSLYTAQRLHLSGENLEATLIDLLVDRTGQSERDLTTHILNQAIATVPKLTKQERSALVVMFFVNHSRYTGPFDLPSFYNYVSEYLAPFVAEMPERYADLAYMQYTGVGSVNTASTMLAEVFYYQAYGFFVKGFERETAPEAWIPALSDPDIFIPCLRDPRKLQIKARSRAELVEIALAKDFPSLVSVDVQRMYVQEVEEDLVAHVPALARLFALWDPIGYSHFGLTAVGIAIAHASQREVVGHNAPLDAFLV